MTSLLALLPYADLAVPVLILFALLAVKLWPRRNRRRSFRPYHPERRRPVARHFWNS